MKKLRFLVSLTTADNDYQQEQATFAEKTARRLGADLRIVYAGNDAVTQSQQILQTIQAPAEERPDGIIVEPVGTGMAQAARAAVSAEIGWAVLNREVEYIPELQQAYRAPTFLVTSDHEEVGRMQAQQVGAILPRGGTILLIQGPSGNSAAQQRTAGLESAKPGNIMVKTLRAQWTEASARQSTATWLRMPTSRAADISLVAGQDDSMAVGARKAFEEVADPAERERWLRLPFLGCDGVPQTGQAWVLKGLLAATVVIPANTGTAMELLATALRSGTPPAQRTVLPPSSFPSIEELKRKAARR